MRLLCLCMGRESEKALVIVDYHSLFYLYGNRYFADGRFPERSFPEWGFSESGFSDWDFQNGDPIASANCLKP